jgi:Tfp pilus assembly protein PilO
MNVKLLLFPLSITIAIAVLIFYAKPELDIALSNRAAMAEKAAFAQTIDAKIQNVQTLDASLNTNKESVDTVMHYFPNTRDDERIVDGVNFSAAQSGLALTSVKLEKVADPTIAATPVAKDALGAGPTIFTGNADINTLNQKPFVPAVPKSVSAVITASGSYENIRDTVGRISHMDRFQNFTVVSINRSITPQSANSKVPAGALDAVLTANFTYLPKAKAQGNFNNPALNQQKYDFSIVAKLKQYISAPIPSIEVGAAGVSNPFLR